MGLRVSGLGLYEVVKGGFGDNGFRAWGVETFGFGVRRLKAWDFESRFLSLGFWIWGFGALGLGEGRAEESSSVRDCPVIG